MQMVAFSNKYSFLCIHMLTPFCIKTNPRENRFFAAKWTIGEKKGTHNVKFSTENLTKIIILHARASGQRHRKDVRLQQPARAGAGHATHIQRQQHRGDADVNRPSTSGFLLVDTALNSFRPFTFWNIAMFRHRRMWHYFWFHHILVWHFVHDRGVGLGFAAQRHKRLSVCRKIKSKDYFCFVFLALSWLKRH